MPVLSQEWREVARREIEPRAARFDREERIPLDWLAELEIWGAVYPEDAGGLGMDMISFGRLNEDIGRACSSVRDLLTVHSMVGRAIHRWGSDEQREEWLPRLAAGRTLAAFCLSEPEAGSDARHGKTTAVRCGDEFLLSGTKAWVTGGQIAAVLLVVAQCDGAPTAFLVEHDPYTIDVAPIRGMLGHRASMLASIRFSECRVPARNLLGRIGSGFSHVASTALDLGRYSVAWGCVGIAQGCLEADVAYAARRRQFGVPLQEHQLIQRMIADTATDLRAARALCVSAGNLRESGHPEAILETCAAKYFASRVACRAATDAVQIHGAAGCVSDAAVQRYYRDAKIMEIIEGSNEMQQIMIARHECARGGMA